MINKKFLLAKIIYSLKRFKWDKFNYNYFVHKYNHTYLNERAVEVAIFKKILLNNKNKKILEVGNVLGHYFPITHTVVDKYEKSPGVINQDIIDYVPKKKFNLILAISTFEHIGYDEGVKNKDPKKISKTLKQLFNLLSLSGEIIFSVPIGYNPYLDLMIKNDFLKLSKQSFLCRTSNLNLWQACSKETALKNLYNHKNNFATAIMVGQLKRD